MLGCCGFIDVLGSSAPLHLGFHVVGEGEAWLAFGFLGLLTQGVEGGVVVGEDDVVAIGVGGEESVNAFGGEALVGDDFF